MVVRIEGIKCGPLEIGISRGFESDSKPRVCALIGLQWADLKEEEEGVCDLLAFWSLGREFGEVKNTIPKSA
jgi:hypothetical protein